MIDHRRMQRTLFRMQHDPGFAARLRARDAEAASSTGLSALDLAQLLSASAAAITADAGGKRRAQFLRNVSSEHALTVSRALSGADPLLLESFTASHRFHDAIREDLRLPIAFGLHACERAAQSGDPLLAALASMELAMARARRGPFMRPEAPPDGFVLGPRADVLTLPEGSIAAAAELRGALDAHRPIPDALSVEPSRKEHALVLGGAERSPHRLAEAAIEQLSPLAGRLLLLARDAPDAARIAAFCAAEEVTADELASFVADLVADGILTVPAAPPGEA